jgi:hypothetical protein
MAIRAGRSDGKVRQDIEGMPFTVHDCIT